MAAASEVCHWVASCGRQSISNGEEALPEGVEEAAAVVEVVLVLVEKEEEQGRSSSSACRGHAGLPSTAESSAALISV